METLNALKILESIHSQMSLEDVLRLVIAAKKDLDLKDTAQVAEALGVSKATVYKRAGHNNIGTLIAARARVYSPSDVEELRKLIFGYKGQQPATLALIAEMRVMRDQGKTLAVIGAAFGKTESYVSKLLKGARDAK